MSHRLFLPSIAALALAAAACSSQDMPPPTVDAGAPPHVDPFIGSGGFAYSFGSAFAGAAWPLGMAKVGPDTTGTFGTVNFLHYSGYWFGDDTIQGFSHLHLHGTGATDYGVLGVMPSDGFDAGRTTRDGYGSKFQKANETASPGYYGVILDRGTIHAEMVATAHAAHHRFTYPTGAPAQALIFDLDHHLEGGKIQVADVTIDPGAQRLRGHLHATGGMSNGFGGFDLYYEARFGRTWQSAQVWHDGGAPSDGKTATGTGVGCVLLFDPASADPIEMQIGLSFVSAAGAAANLAAELPAWSFDDERTQAAAAWAALVNRVTVSGGTNDQRTMLMTSVYHAFLMPSVQSDVDGSYRGHDGQVHMASGFRYATDQSLWDTYRSLNPFYSLVAPEIAGDAIRSLHEMAKLDGYFSKWPISDGDAGSMIGASAEMVVSDAYQKGVPGIDYEGAYQILRSAALDPMADPAKRGGRDKVVPYMMLGYVPATGTGSVSVTTEYAREDFALGLLAAGLGHSDDAKLLATRSLGWRALYDPMTGLLWGKHANGDWSSPHDDATTVPSTDFVEANAWQSVWMPSHDLAGLAMLAGGDGPLVDKLESFFDQAKADWDTIGPKDTTRRGAPKPYYWASNEPDMHSVYLFAQLGRPDLTQKWVRWILTTQYGPGADGIPGNDDGGTMSTWYAWSALGIYPLVGGDRYAIGAPLFSHAEIAVAGGTFTIDAPDASADNLYVQSAMLDGNPLTTPQLKHSDLAAGHTLSFVMGPAPSMWGRTQ